MSRISNSVINTKGISLPTNAFVVIINTNWNENIIDSLTKGCIEELEKFNISYKIFTVPGAVEIPYAIKTYWSNHEYRDTRPHAFIALGCVIKGDTPHFDYVCNMVSNGISILQTKLPLPIIFGILTVLTDDQAQERLGGKHGHKGNEAGITAAKMMSISLDLKN